MSRIFVLAGLCIAAFLGGSCSPAAELLPHTRQLGILERIQTADLIVVGVLESEQPVSGGYRTVGAEILPLQLMAVKVRPESVLKGSYKDGQLLEFLYYKATGAWDGPAPNILVPGERDVFFLKREGKILRATNDAYSSHTEVVTGRHFLRPESSNEGVRKTLARLLLLPGENLDVTRYVRSLYVEREYSLSIAGESETAESLRTLLQNSNGAIRGRACIWLAQPPLNEIACLRTIRDDAAIPAGTEDERARSWRNSDYGRQGLGLKLRSGRTCRLLSFAANKVVSPALIF